MNNDKTIEKICKDYQWLSRKCAQIYVRKNPNLDESELVASGNLGLVIGAQKWDETRGVKFETHLFWWINAEIRKSIYENRNVHIPWNRINQQYRLNRDNSDKDRVVHKELYLQTIQDNTETHYVVDALRTRQKNTDDKDHILKMIEMSDLSEVESKCIIMRFGLDDGEDKILEDIAAKLDMTAMGVWKAIERAKDKLKPFLGDMLK